MVTYTLHEWVTRPFPKTWTHIVAGHFADPQLATQAATDLFCFDADARVGGVFANVREGHLDDGTVVPRGPRRVGGLFRADRRWTHVVHGPFNNEGAAFFSMTSTPA